MSADLTVAALFDACRVEDARSEMKMSGMLFASVVLSIAREPVVHLVLVYLLEAGLES